ncbi:MAG: 2-C-methyl-D-erythritol 4-phosphate cytidylyltransferase [Candidatus Diapherotrites archaeon]
MGVHVLVGAGGSGSRMKTSVNKSFLMLGGKPIIAHSLQLFQEHEKITSITVIIHSAWMKPLLEWINRLHLTKVKKIVEGGKERQDSVRNGLMALQELHPENHDVVLVHNAANPLISKELISECIHAAQHYQASAAAYRVKDTIKKVGEDGKIIETLKRDELWGMQTPQCIQYGVFLQAHEKALKEGFYGTDDVQLVERLGIKPVVVDGGYENIKITTQEDLFFAEKILQKRNEEKEKSIE